MNPAAAFWNDVFLHPESNKSYVADHGPKYFFDVLNLAGEFEREFAEAPSVLDVGPGYGRLLEVSKGTRYAIEVSDINFVRLSGNGVRVTKPGSSRHDGANIALAWSVSCFPHCDYETQHVLFAQVHRALKPGGVFYLEHVNEKPDAPGCVEDLRMPSGRYHLALPVINELEGFRLSKAVTREIGSGYMIGWVARLVKS